MRHSKVGTIRGLARRGTSGGDCIESEPSIECAMIRRCLAACLLALSGCATITEGSTQQIAIKSDPPHASCELVRNGATLMKIDSAPATVTVEKSPDDITVTCTKPGYDPGREILKPTLDRNVVANVLMTAGVGYAVDSATGATHRY